MLAKNIKTVSSWTPFELWTDGTWSLRVALRFVSNRHPGKRWWGGCRCCPWWCRWRTGGGYNRNSQEGAFFGSHLSGDGQVVPAGGLGKTTVTLSFICHMGLPFFRYSLIYIKKLAIIFDILLLLLHLYPTISLCYCQYKKLFFA